MVVVVDTERGTGTTFRLERTHAQIRAGGMGEVYEAQDIMRRSSWSLLQPGGPVDDHCDRCGA